MKKLTLTTVLLLSMVINTQAQNSNSTIYSVETLTNNITIITTNHNLVVIGDETGELKFTLDNNTRLRLSAIINDYKELSLISDKASYNTIHPPSIMSSDRKYIQFIYTYNNTELKSNLRLKVDMTGTGTYTEPFVIKVDLDQWLVIIETINKGFTYMDELRAEIMEIRALEQEIRGNN
jgi:hypothetical protein